MSIAKVASRYQGSSDGNQFTTTSIDSSGAGFVIVGIADFSGDPASTISDNKSTSFGAALFTKTLGNVRLQAWAAQCTGGTGHTFTIGNNPTNPSIAALTISGAATSSAVDQTNSATDGTGATVQPGSITPTQANEILVTIFGSPDTYSSIDTPFTPADGSVNATGFALAIGLAYEIQAPGPTARNPTWTWPGTTDKAAVILSVKAASVGSSSVSPSVSPSSSVSRSVSSSLSPSSSVSSSASPSTAPPAFVERTVFVYID